MAISRQLDTTQMPASIWPSPIKPVEASSSKWVARSRPGRNAGSSSTTIAGRSPTMQVSTSSCQFSVENVLFKVWDKVTSWVVSLLSRARKLWLCQSINSSVYILCCRQTWDQDERSHLLPSHRGGVLWPFKECAQSKSVYMCAWFLACGIIYTSIIFFEYCWHLFIFCFSFFLCLSPPHTCKTSPFSLLLYINCFFPKLKSLPHQRAPTPRWPSVWRPMIECTTWWLRRPRPCVSGWTSWLRALRDTCISWCSWSPASPQD